MSQIYIIDVTNRDEVQTANVHTQKPLTREELLFIAKYPEQARKILTINPKGG